MTKYQITESAKELSRELGQLLDVDPLEDGHYAAVFQNEGKQIVNFLDQIIPLPVVLAVPKIRMIDETRFLIAASNSKLSEKGAYIFSKEGQMISNFISGDAVEDIIVTTDKIVFTYFDEGIFGGGPISSEGLAVFDLNGTYQVGYRSLLGSEAENIADCYCACRRKDNVLDFCAYTEFRIVKWNLDSFRQEITPIPDNLHGIHGLTTDGTTFYLHSPYDSRGSLYAWQPGSSSPQKIGFFNYHLRGLPNARFLSKGDHGYTVIKIESV